MNLEAVNVVASSGMHGRSILAAILLMVAIAACTQPAPGGGGESEPAPSVAPSSAEPTPYSAPGY